MANSAVPFLTLRAELERLTASLIIGEVMARGDSDSIVRWCFMRRVNYREGNSNSPMHAVQWSSHVIVFGDGRETPEARRQGKPVRVIVSSQGRSLLTARLSFETATIRRFYFRA